ncbi:Biopolymer transport protein ExbD/TolR [Stieleria maiorica]|uniref:Biopolymer transport protein ExbD/TolR n=1 Tax=Stieleria maiorica TaxID=2795974 RepID=A0A5B9M599_9BACT|nr:biopolymer transporter ExbD [Stieleria maiorica]QEF96378.1 Biopolymer transport protein ExbD/TolR [Stieleria maiorica]
MTRRNEQELDLTPMIDVTFLILIFFMVTASFSLQHAIETPTPESDQASRDVIATQLDPIRLHVDRHGSFLLMTTDWQKEIVGKQELVNQLAAAKGRGAMHVELRIEVESAARLQHMVDAMDAATIAGFDRYQLAESDSELI